MLCELARILGRRGTAGRLGGDELALWAPIDPSEGDALVAAVQADVAAGLAERGVVVEVLLGSAPAPLGADEWLPSRAEVVVPVSGGHAASLRALLYARSLGIRETKAIFFADDEEDTERIQRDWRRFPTGLPLEIVEAPYRDLGRPLLDYLRGITADPEAVAVVVMPELVVRGTDRLLHNQRALYVKRLLLFEPRVILTSVPFQLT